MPSRSILVAIALLYAIRPTFAFADQQPIRRDGLGDPLPPRAIVRLGTHRLCCHLPSAIALAPDASTLAAFDLYGSELRVWDLPSGRLRWRVRLSEHDQNSPNNNRLAFSPDGKRLAFNDSRSHLRIWDALSGRLLHTLGESSKSAPVAFSPDGRKLAAAAVRTVEIWEVESGKRLASWEIENWVSGLAWPAEGRTLLVSDHPYQEGQYAERVSLMDRATGKRRRSWILDPEGNGWSALSRDGKWIALRAGDYKHLGVRDAVCGAEKFRIPLDTDLGMPIFSGDGRLLAFAAKDDVLRLWETATGKLLRSVPLKPGEVDSGSLALSGDGKVIAFKSGLEDVLHVWNVEKGQPPGELLGHRHGPLRVAFSADGKEVVTTNVDTIERPSGRCAAWSLRRWDAVTGAERLGITRDIGGQVQNAVFSRDGRRAGLVLSDFTLRLWDAERGRELHRWRLPIYDGIIRLDGTKDNTRSLAVKSFVFAPDGSELLAAGGQKVHRWEVETGKTLPSFSVREAKTVWLPDSGLHNDTWVPVAVWSESRLQLLEARTGRPGPHFPPQGGIKDLALSRDGRTLVALEDGCVHLWETASGVSRGEIQGTTKEFGGTLALSPDGRLLAAAAKKEGTILVWDLAANQERALLEGHRTRLKSLAFSPDSQRLVSGACANVAYVWDVTGPAAEKLKAEELERLWGDLHAPDGARAYQAIGRLAGDPARAVPFLRRQLVQPDEARTIAKLIADLDSDSFAVRQAASARLSRLGTRAAPALTEAMKGKPTLEVRRRITELLRKLPPGEVPSAKLVGTRIIEALEHAGTAAAREALQELARQEAWRDEATAALRRMRSAHPPAND